MSYQTIASRPTFGYGETVTGITTEQRDSSTARVPTVPRGRAIVIVRYDEEKAVVMNPEDFRRFEMLDQDLDELASSTPELTELALKAHALEDTPEPALEDADQIRAYLGL